VTPSRKGADTTSELINKESANQLDDELEDELEKHLPTIALFRQFEKAGKVSRHPNCSLES